MTKVAIACQGGGSHTAFTAGVLDEILPWLEPHDCELVGLSGTSGGAVSAVAAWNGFLADGPRGASERLRDIWADVAISSPVEDALNRGFVWTVAAQQAGVPVPAFSPYALPWSDLGKRRFRRLLERHIEFDRFEELADGTAPELVIGTVNVEAGDFETFTNADITSEAMLASAAVPTLFEAVEVHGHAHWDGLFAQNPPIHELMTVDAARKPDELWIVQINPQATPEVPRTLGEINDRRQELAANISLTQEVRFIEQVNDWIAAGELSADRYTQTTVRRIPLDRRLALGSKLERSEAFIGELVDEGRERASAFVDEIEGDLGGAEDS